jgi:hypothetical protein
MSATSRPGIAWHSGRRWIKPLPLHQVRAAKVTFWSLCINRESKEERSRKFRAKASVRSCKMMVRKKDRFSELFNRPRFPLLGALVSSVFGGCLRTEMRINWKQSPAKAVHRIALRRRCGVTPVNDAARCWQARTSAFSSAFLS